MLHSMSHNWTMNYYKGKLAWIDEKRAGFTSIENLVAWKMGQTIAFFKAFWAETQLLDQVTITCNRWSSKQCINKMVVLSIPSGWDEKIIHLQQRTTPGDNCPHRVGFADIDLINLRSCMALWLQLTLLMHITPTCIAISALLISVLFKEDENSIVSRLETSWRVHCSKSLRLKSYWLRAESSASRLWLGQMGWNNHTRQTEKQFG